MSWPTNCILAGLTPLLGTLTEVSDATFEGSSAALGNSWRAFLLFRDRQAMVDAPRHGRSVRFGCSLDLGTKLGDCAVYLYSLLRCPVPQTSLLRRLWEGWKRVGRKIGDFQARVLLTLIYAIFVLPFGLVVTLLGDPLRIRRARQHWQEHPDDKVDLRWAHRQW